MRKIKARNIWIEKDGNHSVDITEYLLSLANDEYQLSADSLLNSIQALSTGPSLLFDGTASDVTLADNANLDVVVNQDFAFEIKFKPTDVTRATDYLINKEAGGIGWGLYIHEDDIYLRFDDNTVDGSAKVATGVLTNDRWYHVIVSCDRINGNAYTYVNGVLQSTTDISLVVKTLANAGVLHIGNDSADASEFQGEINLVRFWNKTLSQAEVTNLTLGGGIPTEWQGATQTTHFTTAKDGTFTGGSTNWENVDIGTTFDETDDLSLVASATGQYCKITFASMTGLASGKHYRLQYKYTETVAGFEWKLKGAATQILGDAVAGTAEVIDFEADEAYLTTDWLGIYAKTTATAAGNFDDLVLYPIGCVFELDSSNISGTLWKDSSGNGMDATVSATVEGVPKMTPYYIPAVQFGITTGNSGDINSTGTLGHSYTDSELSTCGYIPFECMGGIDVTKDLYVQVIWAPIDGTTANGVTFIVTYDADALESGVLTAPGTALDTVIVEDIENDTPYVIQKTAKGVIAANTLTEGNPIAWRVEGDVIDSGNDPGCWFIGLLLSQ